MTAYDDETLSVTAVADVVLDPDKLAPDGQSKATRVVLQNSSTADTHVHYRFGSSPVPGSDQGLVLPTWGQVTIDGYDNLVNLKLRRGSGSTATVFAVYFR